jgi:glycosyltransferase involved in cell wall biosynthesis
MRGDAMEKDCRGIVAPMTRGGGQPGPSVAVVVPTYRRAQCLARCLEALSAQTRHPDRIVVVARTNDRATLHELERIRKTGIGFELVRVSRPGKAAAIDAGVGLCSEEVVAMVDDDTAAWPEWLARLLSHYDDDVGGVGGRDAIEGGGVPRVAIVVGKVTWYGRVIGNHHLGAGPPRDVDILKGVNTSFRRDLWRSRSAVRGVGAQPNLELEICLRARRRGWRLIYDADAVVDHFPARRYDGGGRGEDSAQFLGELSFNSAYAMTKNLPWRTLVFALPYMFVVGDRSEPGVVQFVAESLRDRVGLRARLRAFAAVTRGHAGGVAAGLRVRGQW